MNEFEIIVDTKQVKKRFKKLNKYASKSNTKIVPVIKNNCNGLGFKEMYKLYSKMEGVTRIATSYANEWLKSKKIAKDTTVQKYSWIWTPDDKYLKVKNLVLVCKTFDQLDFVIKNNIPYYLEFVLDSNGMYRGGFVSSDLVTLKEAYKLKEINFQSHNPHEDENNTRKYYESVNNLIAKIRDFGINVNEVSIENSYTFTHADHLYPDGYARLGETLLLPHDETDRFASKPYDPITWKTYVAAISDIPKGCKAGYDMVEVKKNTKVAVLPVGYYSIEVEHIKYVDIKNKEGDTIRCNVICAMHDTMIVDITAKKVEIGNEVILNNFALFKENYNRCIQKTWKVNPDMVKTTYI